jgi:hypothetical protein
MNQDCIDRPVPLHSTKYEDEERYEGPSQLAGVVTLWQLCCACNR